MKNGLHEGDIIYMVFISCLKEDVQCTKPMNQCKNCTPDNFEAHISRVVYTADKSPLLGVKYFVELADAEAKKSALTKDLRLLRGSNNI